MTDYEEQLARLEKEFPDAYSKGEGWETLADVLSSMVRELLQKNQQLQHAHDRLWSGVDNVTRWDVFPNGARPEEAEISETGEWVLHEDLAALLVEDNDR